MIHSRFFRAAVLFVDSQKGPILKVLRFVFHLETCADNKVSSSWIYVILERKQSY